MTKVFIPLSMKFKIEQVANELKVSFDEAVSFLIKGVLIPVRKAV